MSPGPLALLSAANRRTRTTALGLVLANLTPLVGVIALGWSPFSVVMAYVVETLVVGVYTWLRILLARQTPFVARVGTAMFFTVHYGLFVLVQTVFITIAVGTQDWTPAVQQELAIAGACFFISHGISFVTHYLGAGEYREAVANIELFRPYGRIFTQQLVAIFGGWLALGLGGARIGPVVILVVCKLVIDLGVHLRSHGARAPAEPREPFPG